MDSSDANALIAAVNDLVKATDAQNETLKRIERNLQGIDSSIMSIK